MFGTASETSKTYNARKSALIKAGYLAEYDGTLMPTSIAYINDLGEEVTSSINPYDKRTAYATGRSLAKADRIAGRPNRYAQPAPAPEPTPVTITKAEDSRCEGALVVISTDGVMLGVYSPYRDRGWFVTNNVPDTQGCIFSSEADCLNWLDLVANKQSCRANVVLAHDVLQGRITNRHLALTLTQALSSGASVRLPEETVDELITDRLEIREMI